MPESKSIIMNNVIDQPMFNIKIIVVHTLIVDIIYVTRLI